MLLCKNILKPREHSQNDRNHFTTWMMTNKWTNLFAFCVQSGSSFVEQKYFGVSDQRSGDCDSLFLSSTQLGSFVSGACLVALNKFMNEISRKLILAYLIQAWREKWKGFKIAPQSWQKLNSSKLIQLNFWGNEKQSTIIVWLTRCRFCMKWGILTRVYSGLLAVFRT